MASSATVLSRPACGPAQAAWEHNRWRMGLRIMPLPRAVLAAVAFLAGIVGYVTDLDGPEFGSSAIRSTASSNQFDLAAFGLSRAIVRAEMSQMPMARGDQTMVTRAAPFVHACDPTNRASSPRPCVEHPGPHRVP